MKASVTTEAANVPGYIVNTAANGCGNEGSG